MTRDEIKRTLQDNLQRAGVQDAEVRVQQDPYSGWRIAVISPAFQSRSLVERKALALAGLEQLEIEWLDLLTPTECEWAGSLPADSDLQQLPLWPEALARGRIEEQPPPLFASDLEEDLPRPIVITFYSLRGGVGRSTALAYTGRLLAARGRKVVCVDMDLEAPGLAALFGKEAELEPGRGTAALLTALDRGEEPDISKHLIRVLEEEDLYCLPAGRPDAAYARMLRLIDPSAWYREERNPLRDLIEHLGKRLPFTPDVILLDSRTGITPSSGPLLFDLADLAVVVFYPHPQAATGTGELVRALLASKTRRQMDGRALTPEPRFLVSPIPASKAPEVVQRYEHRAKEWIAEWMGPRLEQRPVGAGPLVSDITHFVPYREALATSDQILSSQDAWRDFEPVAEWIERFLPSATEQRTSKSFIERKQLILDELKFSAGTAEEQEKEELLETLVETDLVSQAMDPRIPLVLGRKGTGKTTLFRRLGAQPGQESVIVLAPAHLRHARPWLLSFEGFREVDKVLNGRGADWSQFWSFYTCLAIITTRKFSTNPITDKAITWSLRSVTHEVDVVNYFREALSTPQYGLRITGALRDLHEAMPDPLLLLFDGLDTNFGPTEQDRERRKRAIEGLFTFWADQSSALKSLHFKILLREDIWRKVRFENKSHLYGRSVTLRWKEQSSFFKVAVRQALRSEAFRQQLESVAGGSRLLQVEPAQWTAADVEVAWNLLVGERMKGGNTTFTWNWVWNRLADANDDHSPRHLLQLFREATSWEQDEHRKSPYERSIIRPRALIERLPEVSRLALDALNEEYPELQSLFERLRSLGRTHVSSKDLKGLDAEVQLAREIGLLGVYEGQGEDIERFVVPELYRYGLDLRRPGQA
jgi:MinD-like ATPase involved in chromosome partitioning or flagellar assembly